MSLPVCQVRKRQMWPAELFIEPKTQDRQGYLCRSTSLQFVELMGPFPVQAKSIQELVGHCFAKWTTPARDAEPSATASCYAAWGDGSLGHSRFAATPQGLPALRSPY